MENEQHQEIQLPIDKLSYSALTQLLRNPIIFKLKYILNQYDNKMSVSGMVGRAGHEALRIYNQSHPEQMNEAEKAEARETACDEGLRYLNEFSDAYIDYGKTGSREQMLKSFAQAMGFYFAEEPEYNEIICCEEKLEAQLKTIDGQILPLPAVGIPDVVDHRKDGGYDIIDTKFTRTFTDYDNEDYIKIIQAQFLWHLLRETKGITADRCVFREIKTTANSGPNEGKPQIRDWVIPFSHEPYRIIFYNLYRDVVKFLSHDPVFLPNLSDPFDGEHAGMIYAQGLINADMSDVEVMHKVRDLAFVSKKFVSSRLDRVENQHLQPEEKIKMRLAEFGIPIEPAGIQEGASVIQYRFKVSSGVRMSVFEKHRADIEMAIEAASHINILAPIPGTSLVGIEVPKAERQAIKMENKYLAKGTLQMPLGLNINGELVRADLTEMPHLLIAGATGSGKSMLLHNIIQALTKQMTPEQMELVLIDPKRVELRAFARKKHLRHKVLFEKNDALRALCELVDEMEKRYTRLERFNCRDIEEYKKKALDTEQIPYIVCVIDEFADFMMRPTKKNKKAKKEALEGEENIPDAEYMIVRLAQMARATGIHLIISTQRPSVDIITGLIKANFPARIALTTSSATDSRIILDELGAERLNGKGDMIFKHPGTGNERLQGFIN